MKKSLLASVLFFGVAMAQETQKPFVLEHIFHEHILNLVNATVYQQVDSYGAVYNSSRIFGTFDFTDKDELFINASITFGNGITYKTEREGYSISTTADDLEDYLRDINGTGRKYLLELFYQKKIGKLSITGGLIDSTAFVDTSRYANDELTQFLNSAFVNNPIAVLPSYNPGVYIHYQLNNTLSISGVYMQNKPDKGNVGIVEFDYETDKLSLRPYYYYLFGTEENKGFGLSSDYTLYDDSGVFFRCGFSTADYDYFLSGGIQISNIFYNDKLGLGYGFIKGDTSKDINVSEGYYTISLNDYVFITGDIQYLDEVKSDFVYGLRFYLSY